MDTPIPLAFQNLLDTIPDGTPGKTSFEIIAKQFGVVERELAAEKARGDRLEKALRESRIHALNEARTMAGRLNDIANACDAALGDSNG